MSFQKTSLTDDEYNQNVLQSIEQKANSKGFKFVKESDSDNLYTIKNSESTKKLGFIFSGSGKQHSDDVYLGVPTKMVNFLKQVDMKDRFLVIINNDVKNFLVLPYEIEQTYARFVSGEQSGKWDKTGKEQHAFHITISTKNALLPTNDNIEDKYFGCTGLLGNTEILFDPLAFGKEPPLESKNQIEMVTFHPSYSYEEFIQGYRPKTTDDDEMTYELQPGAFYEICKSATNDPDRRYVLIIDEINRGNIPKILGELITLLEKGYRGKLYLKLAYSRENFTVPRNLYVIGTMNTADRSLTQLDAALRRRFAFVELTPDYDVLGDQKINNIILAELLRKLNHKLLNEGLREKQIGHSYFLNEKGSAISKIDELQFAFKYEIIPLLQDYFYEDYSKLEDILGKEIIDKDEMKIKDDVLNDSNSFNTAIENKFFLIGNE